jgi:hypothetical protein
MKELHEIYPGVTDDAVAAAMETASQFGLDPCTRQMVMYNRDGTWMHKITRHGYRKLARQRPGYQSHGVISLYKGDIVTTSGQGQPPVIQMNNNSRSYSDLMGAIAWLIDSSVCHIVRVSYADYQTRKHSWSQTEGRPDSMLQKEAEVMVIRMSYSELFENMSAAYVDDAIEDEDMEGFEATESKGDLLEYLKNNKDYITAPRLPLSTMNIAELRALVNEAKKKKGERYD